FNANGSLKDAAVVTVSNNGFNRTVQSDLNGDGATDETRTDFIVLNADGGRTETVTDVNGSGALISKKVAVTSGNGFNKTIQWDLDGVGSFDQTLSDVVIVDANGNRIETFTAFNADGSLKSRSTTTLAADGRTLTLSSDTNGDGVVDQGRLTLAAANADGSASKTITDFN